MLLSCKETSCEKMQRYKVAGYIAGGFLNECTAGCLEPLVVDELQILGGTHEDHCGFIVLGARFQTIIHHFVKSAIMLLVLVERMQL